MIKFSLRKAFTGVLSAAVIAVSPGVQGYQAFAQFNAPIKMTQARLVGLKAPLAVIPSISAGAIRPAAKPPLSPQIQAAQSMSVMAKDLAGPLKAAVAGHNPRVSGGDI